MSEDRLYVLGIAASNEVEDCLREIRRLRAQVVALEQEIAKGKRMYLEMMRNSTEALERFEKQRADLQAANTVMRTYIEARLTSQWANVRAGARLLLARLDALRESEES